MRVSARCRLTFVNIYGRSCVCSLNLPQPVYISLYGDLFIIFVQMEANPGSGFLVKIQCNRPISFKTYGEIANIFHFMGICTLL